MTDRTVLIKGVTYCVIPEYHHCQGCAFCANGVCFGKPSCGKPGDPPGTECVVFVLPENRTKVIAAAIAEKLTA